MRVINLIQKPQLRGAEIFACQLSKQLEKIGHEVLVVTIFKGDAELPFSGNIVHLKRSTGMRLLDLKGWQKFNSIVKEFKPDIVQANAADTLKFAVGSKLVFSWKADIIFRNANKMGDFIDSGLKWKLNKFFLSNSSHIISVSSECRKDLLKTFDFPEKKATTIEIGVEEMNSGGAPPYDLISIFEKGPVITHIGGFVPEKNHSGLLRVFQKTLKKYPDCQLLLIGKGKLEEKIKDEAKELVVNNKVHFLGYRSDIPKILSNSSAFVLPSLIEGLPGVLLESMYLRTPVVAYNVGGVGEIVIPGKTGWLVEKGNEKAFQDSLEEILSGGLEIREKIKGAEVLVHEKFLNNKIALRFASCYKEVLQKNE